MVESTHLVSIMMEVSVLEVTASRESVLSVKRGTIGNLPGPRCQPGFSPVLQTSTKNLPAPQALASAGKASDSKQSDQNQS
jgi:hypothetical protein